MSIKNKLIGIIGSSILGATMLLSPLRSHAEEARNPKWEISLGYVNRNVGDVKFSGRSDFQNESYNDIVGYINEDYLENGQLPEGPMGGVKDSYLSNEVNTHERSYYGIDLYGPIPYLSLEGRITDSDEGELDGITDDYWGHKGNDGSVTFTGYEAEFWAEAHNNSEERIADLGNASGVSIELRRYVNY